MIIETAPIFFSTPKEFRNWLTMHGTTADFVWLGFYKKNSLMRSITYKEALDEVLCFGWIDGLVKKNDAQSYKQRFTPRRAKSVWSKVNTEHIERLTRLGKMTPSGLATVLSAKKDGRWERAYAPARSMEIPTDFINEIKKYPKAYGVFQTLNKTNLYAISYKLATAAKTQTKIKRTKDIIDRLSRGELIHV